MTKKISCIIVEDEPLALEKTQMFVRKVPYLNLKRSFDNPLDAMDFLRENVVDLILLDINMDELSGIELLESLQISGQVIFTTAYPDFALKGYELNITDYLLKPFSFQRFLQAVNRANQKLVGRLLTTHDSYIFIKTENRLEKIFYRDILFIEGMGDYRRIHLLNKRIMTLQTFNELSSLMPEALICRVHKSYMVSLEKIESIERNRIRIGDHIIPISATYRENFFSKIENKH